MAEVDSAFYVVSFIKTLNLNLEQQEMARVLFKTEEDCKEFYIGFRNRNRYVIDDLLDYREVKLNKLKISLDQFLDMCYNMNMLEAMETSFLQPTSLIELSIIDKAIEEGKTSLEIIYNGFQNNPNKNVLQNVL